MIITNGLIVTCERPNRILTGHALVIRNGVIEKIGPQQEIMDQCAGEEIVNARSQLIFPGLICSHTHFYGALSRGMDIPGQPPSNFPEILMKLWWQLDRSLDMAAIGVSTDVCLIEAVRYGTTTLFDHHASPNQIAGSLERIAESVLRAGVRASLCYEVTDRNGEFGAQKGIEENVSFIRSVGKYYDGQLSAMFGLHASLTLSDATLESCDQLAQDGIGFHIHVAEHPADEYDSVQKSKLRVVDRLNKFGILGPKTIAVHAVHVDAKELFLLKETETWVSHQPRSNMNNGVGLPPIESMLRMGLKVCLGNDGFSNSMWEEMQTAYLAHKLFHLDPQRMPASAVFEMAIWNNSALAGKIFGKDIGVIQKGAVADLIFVEYYPVTPLTVDNLAWHMIFGFRSGMVTTTIVGGKLLMHDRQLLVVDEERVFRESLKVSKEVWKKYQESFIK